MVKLVSMKITPKERKEEATETNAAAAPGYPYGLSISLDEDALEKLGYDASDFKVGAKMSIVANVSVDGVSSSASVGGKSQRVSLQITELCVEDEAMKKGAAVEKLYDKGEA